jgi:hypothetical protein
MRIKIYTAFIALSLIGAILIAASSSEQLVNSKCGTCHKLDSLCKNLGKYDKAGWDKVVDSMLKKGALVNKSEKETISTYLAGLKPGSKPVCK